MRTVSFSLVLGALLATLGLPFAARGQTPEFRAAWADIFHSGMGSQTEVNNLVNALVSGHYNAVIVQVVGYMDSGTASHGAQYKSGILPWSSRVTASFDPLAYLCTKAHANGIEVHAWLGGSGAAMYRVSTTWPPAGNATLASHPEWFIAPYTNSEGGAPVAVDGIYALDMGSPDVQEYIVSIVRELVTNYPIDGINWDDELNNAGYAAGFGYPAYSQASYPRSGLARYRINTGYSGTPSNTDPAWSNYRRRFKNELMARVQAEIQSIKSNPRQPLRHTSAALAYSPVPGSCDFTTSVPYQYYCDWAGMLRNGWLDAVIPQTYSSTTFSNWVNLEASCWQSERAIFPGIGAYLQSDATIAGEITYTRSKGLQGNSIYSYAVPNSAGNNDWWAYALAHVYTNTVSTPPMPWRNPATATEGIVWGRVMDYLTGQYVDDATVTVSGGPAVKTDGNGYYVATLVPAAAGGTVHSTTASKAGFLPHTVANLKAMPGDIVRYDFLLNVTPPLITQQPQSTAVTVGSDADFSVTASGTQPLAYQWRFNATNLIAGATASAYTRVAAQLADAGSYDVVITNIGGSLTSAAAVLTVTTLPVPPTLSSQPSSLSLIAGQDAAFSVTAEGAPPLAYQWRWNNVDIPGATASAYTRANAQPADAGSYSVVVTNTFGAITSAPATLTINLVLAADATAGGTISRSPDQAAYAPDSTVTLTATPAYGFSFTGWSGDAAGTANPLNVVLTTNKTVSANFAGTVADIILDNTSAGVTFTGDWQAGTSSVDKYGPDYRFASTSAGGLSNVVYRPDIATPGRYDVYIWYPQGGNRATNAPWRVVYNGGATNLTVNQQVNGGEWRLIAPACPFWTGTGGYVQLSNGSPQTAVVLADAVRFAWSAAQDVPPQIITPPQSLSTNAGANVAFTVLASGTPEPSFQWRLNGADLPGATSSTYTRSNLQVTDAGSYSVVVSNLAGVVTSPNAVLAVVQPYIESLHLLGDQGFELQMHGGPGRFALEVTRGFVTWTQLTTLSATGTVFWYLDPDLTQTSRFYRLKGLP